MSPPNWYLRILVLNQRSIDKTSCHSICCEHIICPIYTTLRMVIVSRAEWLQETVRMRFEEAYEGWQTRRLSQEEAARLLGVCERTFRRYINRYHEGGLQGLADKRLSQISRRPAPMDEVIRLVEQYQSRHGRWSARHFYSWHQRDGVTRSYSWVKNRSQESAAVPKTVSRGVHRKRRERSPLLARHVVAPRWLYP